MKKLLLMLALVVTVGWNMSANTWTSSVTKDNKGSVLSTHSGTSAPETWTDTYDNLKVVWDLAYEWKTSTQFVQSGNNGLTLGASKKGISKVTISTEDIPGTITEVVASVGSNDKSSTVSVSVGGVQFSPDSYTLTSGTASEKSFEGTASGKIEIVLNVPTADKQATIKSLTVTYTPNQGGDNAPSTPTFTPVAGTYTEAQNVTIACATEGATLEYSKDGENWLPYSEAIPVTKSVTLYAKATKEGESATASADYVIKQVVKVSSIADMYEKIAKPAAGASSEQFVVDFESVVIASGAGNNYVYDGEKYSLIYKQGKNLASTTKVAKGWTATLKNYNGLYEIEPAVELTTLEGGVLPEPTVVTAEAINADNQALYAKINNVTVSDATPANAAKYTVTIDGQTIDCYNRFGVASQPEGLYDVVCIISVNNNSPQILPISFSKVEVPVTLGEIVATYGEDNTPVEEVLEGIVAGTVFNFSAENAESIVVTDSEGTTIASGTDSAQWIATVTAGEEITVTATREGEDTKTLSFMVEVVAAPAPQLGDIVVTYGDGNVVGPEDQNGFSVEAGTIFTFSAANATNINVLRWSDESTIVDFNGEETTYTFDEPFTEEDAFTVTATNGTDTKYFEFILTVTKPIVEPVNPNAEFVYVLVTNEAGIAAGSEYVICASATDRAMAAQGGNNRTSEIVTIEDNEIWTLPEIVQIVKLAASNAVDGSFDIQVGETEDGTPQYLYAAGNPTASKNQNYLKTTTTVSESSAASISIDSNNVVKIDFSKATGKQGRFMQYNGTGSNTLFACYVSEQSQNGYEYMRLFKKTELPGMPDFDEYSIDDTKVAIKIIKGQLHVNVTEYDADGNEVVTPASLRASYVSEPTWTNPVDTDENGIYLISLPEQAGNYIKIQAKNELNGYHSEEMVKYVDAEGKILSGVEAVVAEDADAAVEYFNLQGVRVNAEQPGLYIRRQGDKVSKVVIR